MNIYFGENLKQLRIQRGLTQEKLAEFLGVSFQSVSKWERGNVLPDITMIPVIASFFHVSTDYLLGMSKYESESNIQNYVDTYYRLWQQNQFTEVCIVMKQAIREYPGDFRLLVRYMNALIQCNKMQPEKEQDREEIESLYERIQSYCTTDSIRIWSKKLLCDYLRALDREDSCQEKINEIISEMPLMQNSRDFLSCCYFASEKEKNKACSNAVNELISLLYKVIYEKYYNSTQYSVTEKVEAFESILKIIELVYPKEDYGKNYVNVIYLHGYLARFYYQLETPQKTLYHLEQCVSLAIAFDRITYNDKCRQESPFVKDQQITAKDILFSQAGRMRDCVNEYFMKSHGYTEKLYQNPQYQKLQKRLGQD